MTTEDPNPTNELKWLNAVWNHKPIAFTDPSDRAYICVNLIERSIALLTKELEGSFLDVGCGAQPYRHYFNHLSDRKACDFDPKRGDVDFACPADKIPLPDESLDSILCTEVLEHVPDPLAVWREFHRVLRPGGKVLLTTPMYWPQHEVPYDFYRYPQHGLRWQVKESGFELLHLIPRGGPWAMWGQVTIHTMPQLFPFKWLRSLWNRSLLALDRRSNKPHITLGWTLLARKPDIVTFHADSHAD